LGSLDFKIETMKGEILPLVKKAALSQKKFQRKQFKWIESHPPNYPPKNFTPIEEIVFKRSNGNEVRIGGEKAPPFYSFISEGGFRKLNPNKPKVTFDVFDMKIPLPKVLKNQYREVLKDPVGWAELAVKYGADMVTIHFTSTDPGIMDTPVSESANILDEILQRVKVPIIIGGSGNKKKDAELFETLAPLTEGERLMFSSADKVTWDKIVPLARDYDQNVLLWAQLDINDQQKLVEDALAKGMPRNRIVLDPTCATLGYGLEYSYSIFQKIRLAGLNGNDTLNFPISGGTTNAWGAREAWMKKVEHMPQKGGDRALRGPLWEVITALTMSLMGLDLAMMLHPYSAQLFKSTLDDFYAEIPQAPSELPDYESWVTLDF